MSRTRVAVLLACHNRREKTLACLQALWGQRLSPGVAVDGYLVDDGSTDGTREAVQERFPTVRVLCGDGRLYWGGGVRLASSEAAPGGYDYYLWLNDDTVLHQDAIAIMLQTAAGVRLREKACGIVVGSVQDPVTAEQTYGGVVRSSRWHPLRYRHVYPRGTPIPCDTMNGNCVLIPREVAAGVGNIDPAFTHGMGDYDYGLRARRLGYGIWVAPGFVGTCPRNGPEGTWRDTRLPLQERWRKLCGPKGLPVREWWVFTRRHCGWLWPVFWLAPYGRTLLSGLLVWLTRWRRNTKR